MVKASFGIVLVEPRYDGNVGSVARIMKNFGFRNLVLVNPPEIGPEGRKNAMHALDIVQSAKRVKSFEEAAGMFDFIVGTTAKCGGDANHLRTPVFPEELSKALETDGKIGIAFGREDYGLLNEEIDKCDVLVTIPADRDYPTLNVAQSVAIILYGLSMDRNRATAGGKKFREVGKTEREYLLRFYDDLIDATYKQKFEADLAKRTFRQIVGRAFISGREAKTLMGVFRHAKARIDKAGSL